MLDYQPIMHIHTNTVLAIESLVRWNHPELGRLLPDEFIRVAEHTGLVNPLTSFVIDRALTEWPRTDTAGHLRHRDQRLAAQPASQRVSRTHPRNARRPRRPPRRR